MIYNNSSPLIFQSSLLNSWDTFSRDNVSLENFNPISEYTPFPTYLNMIINDPSSIERLNQQTLPPIIPEKKVEPATILPSKECPKPKSKRGRKPKEKTVEMQLLNEKKRLEKNRLFAKENRRRKKEYIVSLETQVISISNH